MCLGTVKVGSSPEGQAFLRAGLQRYVTRRRVQLLDRQVLLGHGLSAQNDAFEYAREEAGRWIAPHHVGMARATTRPQMAIDPAVRERAIGAARMRLAREPTEAAVATEVATYNARIAALNAALAAQRAVLAQAQAQTGRIPQDLIAAVLGLPARDPDLDRKGNRTSTAINNILVRSINRAGLAAIPPFPTLPSGPIAPTMPAVPPASSPMPLPR